MITAPQLTHHDYPQHNPNIGLTHEVHQKQRQHILDLHAKWLRREPDGKRADLFGADLSEANLSGVDLSYADLIKANMFEANLQGADLHWADMPGVIMRGANLRRANLRGSDLREASLYEADFSEANLHEVDLREACLMKAVCTRDQFAPFDPPSGTITGWKKLKNEAIAELCIPEHALRTGCPTTNKKRCSEAVVVSIMDREGQPINEGRSLHDHDFVYRVGETVRPKNPYDHDFRDPWRSGVHFFMTREEAEMFNY